MRVLGGDTWQAIRHRTVQSVALLLLAATVTTLSTLAPLYTVAMAQAVTRLDLQHATPLTTALQLTSQPTVSATGRPVGPVEPATLAGLPAPKLREHYEKPVLTWSSHADNQTFGLSGQLVWRPDACAHLILSGSCPRSTGEIVVSQADLRLPGIRVGGTIDIAGVTEQSGAPPEIGLHIVGAYRADDGSFWRLDEPTGKSGRPTTGGQGHDDWFTTAETFAPPSPALPSSTSAATFPLRSRSITVGALLALPAQLDELSSGIRSRPGLSAVSLTSNIGDVVADVRTQQAQARRTVPLLMLQVVLLALVVFWQLLAAAADQRRPDVALARLRGRGRQRTTRALLRELLPVVEAGVLVGGVGGLLGAAVVRQVLLPAAPFDLPATFWAALIASAACLAALTYLTARNLAGEPVDRLLRKVPPRHRWRWTVLDTVLLTLSAAGVIAFALGGLGRDFALAGPALIALLAGLLLSHTVTPVAAVLGSRALARGRLVRGLAALDATRRPGSRRTITMLTLAAAFLVFFANAWSVGAANRQQVAEQVVGARGVLTVAGPSIARIQQALRRVDPEGRQATPVVLVNPLGNSTAPSTMAVEPRQFSRVALVDDAARRLPWERLVPSTTPPVRITGERFALRATTSGLPTSAGAVSIELNLLRADDTTSFTVELGTLRHQPAGAAPTILRTQLPCTDGCTILNLTVSTTPGADWEGDFTLGPLRNQSTATPWGGSHAWPRSQPTGTSSIDGTPVDRSSLRVRVVTGGESTLVLSTGWLPTTLPTFTIGLDSAPTPGQAVLLGVDRQFHPVSVLAKAPRLPTAPAHALVVDLDSLARGALVDPGDQVQVWLRDDGAQLRHRVTDALQQEGVSIIGTNSVRAQRGVFDDSVATWSLSLALIIGVVTLLIALLAMVVLAVTSWRTSSRDLAALQLNGLRRRLLVTASLLAEVTTVAVAVVVGTGAGILASWLAIDQVPLFADQPALTTLDLAPSWRSITMTAVGTLVVLAVAGSLLARSIAVRARPGRLRDGT
jgi:hypothetical protein